MLYCGSTDSKLIFVVSQKLKITRGIKVNKRANKLPHTDYIKTGRNGSGTKTITITWPTEWLEGHFHQFSTVYTARDLSEKLSVSARTARGYVKSGELPLLQFKMLALVDGGYLPMMPNARLIKGKLHLENGVELNAGQILALSYVYQERDALRERLTGTETELNTLLDRLKLDKEHRNNLGQNEPENFDTELVWAMMDEKNARIAELEKQIFELKRESRPASREKKNGDVLTFVRV